MKMRKRFLFILDWRERSESQALRLQQSGSNLFVYSLVGIVFTLVFSSFIPRLVNQRFLSQSNLPSLDATPEPSGTIWFSVFPHEGKIYAVTRDFKVFNWPQTTTKLKDLANFIEYLRFTVEQEKMAAGLSQKFEPQHSMAVISADQSLTYAHLRPILHALAAVNISSYAFETTTSQQTSTAHATH